MSTHISRTSRRQGFTAIEAMVTVIVAAIFLLAINALYVMVYQSLGSIRARATSNDLAYAYLRKYASAGSTPTWFVCDTTSGSGNTNDLTKNANATGQVLESGTLSASESGLPTPVSYSVRALAIYGCSGTNLNKPIRVDATVTYGASAVQARHSTIVGF